MFLLQMRIKVSPMFVYYHVIPSVEESFERFSCLEFIYEKANAGKPA